MDTKERLRKLRKDRDNYRESLREATAEYIRQAGVINACTDLIKETEETIEWLESGGWDAVKSDH